MPGIKIESAYEIYLILLQIENQDIIFNFLNIERNSWEQEELVKIQSFQNFPSPFVL